MFQTSQPLNSLYIYRHFLLRQSLNPILTDSEHRKKQGSYDVIRDISRDSFCLPPLFFAEQSYATTGTLRELSYSLCISPTLLPLTLYSSLSSITQSDKFTYAFHACQTIIQAIYGRNRIWVQTVARSRIGTFKDEQEKDLDKRHGR